MSKEIAIIKMANSFFREGDFAKALYGYEKFIRIYGNQAPETMLESIRHNIDACRLRQSGISGEDPESHGLHRNRIALLVNPSHAHEVEAAFWSGFAKKLHANDYQVIDLNRSEEHTSELQSLMRISYAVFCLKKKIILMNITSK